ncbi:MAG TPA: hypothetical protein VFI75_10285, partial [Candidatus Acidoferrum sp.]|nr:hypothetical protein [Candidatus Acidoferrum sp.]
MSTITNLKTIHGALADIFRISLSLFISATLFPALISAANTIEPASITPAVPSEPAPRTAIDRSGVLPTRDGLTLHLSTDVG